jgi:putative hemolysin
MGPYVVKTAESSRELIESFRLRHEVFNQEFQGLKSPGLDFDRYDYFFDHLIIVHKESSKIIGTYRLNCSAFSRESYTATEFDLSMLRLQPGPQLELGRACIHKDYRKGSVISLLWRGIAEYMKLSGSSLLFGCSSLKINDCREAALVYKYLLDQGSVTFEIPCQPTRKYQMKDFDAWYAFFRRGLSEKQQQEAQELIPSLLRSYLKLGAQVVGEPAYDAEFDCVDLLTVVKKENLSNSLAERFQVNR